LLRKLFPSLASYIQSRCQEDSNVIQFYKSGEPVPVRASAKELNDHFIQHRSRAVLDKPTRSLGKLTAQGVGREYLLTALWSESGLYSVQDKMVKRMLQCITNTFPTCSRLHIMMGSANFALKANSTLCFIDQLWFTRHSGGSSWTSWRFLHTLRRKC
jgi:hypothetical protein